MSGHDLYNWDEIRAKYETGKYSMKELAEEYGFNRRYGSERKKNNNWVKGRTANDVAEKVQKKVHKQEADKEAELRLEYEKLINNTRRGAYNALMNEKDFNRLKQFKIFSEILRNCRREQWEVNEILEIADKQMSENQEEALDRFLQGIENMPVEE